MHPHGPLSIYTKYKTKTIPLHFPIIESNYIYTQNIFLFLFYLLNVRNTECNIIVFLN